MAKLTLQFKGKPIDVFQLQDDCVTVGREADNSIVIDSLAIAPHHVALMQTDAGYALEIKTEQFPVWLNEQKAADGVLQHGDLIKLGKHTLLYSDDVTSSFNLLSLETEATETEQPEPETSDEQNAPIEEQAFAKSTLQASLQIMNGSDIGRLIPVGRRVTELTYHDLVPAIVARRPNGFFVSRLLDDVTISIAGQELGTESPLQDGDTLHIGEQRLQFFIDEL